MDKIKADQLKKELLNQELAGYKIVDYINCGKSAAVFKSIKDNIYYAIKIFDNDLVEKFGHEIQQTRIEQEIGLKGHNIKNLIGIEEGGKETILESTYYYLIMEFVEGKNLKEFIETENYDQEFIILTLNTLYRVSKDLLNLPKSLVHRDIKPENVMVNKNRELILMDLGVLKFIGAKSISDNEEKQFIGTLRYAPPEFLIRQEQDTMQGWNAVNLYQIGGILHDLTQKNELFHDKIPYTNLVLAIKEDAPLIKKNDYSAYLIQLIRDMLSKDWHKRNLLCSDDRIIKFNAKILKSNNELDAKIEELQSMSLDNKTAIEEIESIRRTKKEKLVIRKDISEKIKPILVKCIKYFVDNNVAKGFQQSERFELHEDRLKRNEFQISNYFYKLSGDYSIGYSKPVLFWIRTKNNEQYLTEINIVGLLLSSIIRESNLQNQKQIVENIAKSLNRGVYTPGQKFHIDFIDVFNGIIDFGDTELVEETICITIAGILKKAKILMKPEVEKHLNFQKRVAEGNSGSYVSTSISSGTIIINKI